VKIVKAIVLGLVVGLLGTQACAQERSWRVYLKLISGQNAPYCILGGQYWVREGNEKFRMFSPDNRIELWSLPMAPDGSVAGETKNVSLNRPIRVSVAAGADPRAFDVLDLAQACRYRMEPM
jgi:hypothetical protein